jgi:hypothetical protein
VPRTCDDSNPCTDDSCDPATGCSSTANAAPCDDGSTCTVGDTCQGGACVGDPIASREPNPRTNGYYKRLCLGPHSGDVLTAEDAACVATVAPGTFGWVSTVADVCAVLGPSTPNNGVCQQSEDDLMSLALNVCKARVCPTQEIDSQCGSNASVGANLLEADAIFSDPARASQSCQHGKCITEEINTGRALEMNSLRVAKAPGGGTKLSWSQPFVDDGETISSYKIRRRVHGSGPFSKIAQVSTLTFTDASTGDFDYEVVAVHGP